MLMVVVLSVVDGVFLDFALMAVMAVVRSFLVLNNGYLNNMMSPLDMLNNLMGVFVLAQVLLILGPIGFRV